MPLIELFYIDVGMNHTGLHNCSVHTVYIIQNY